MAAALQRVPNLGNKARLFALANLASGASGLSGAFTKTLELFFGRDDLSFVITSNAPTAVKTSRGSCTTITCCLDKGLQD